MDHPLRNYIGYRILQIMKAHRVLAEQAFGELGLYPGQEMVLYVLWDREGITQSELGEHLCVDPSTVTKSLQRLQQSGVIERRQDQEDGRVSRVYLTPHGRALRDPLQQIWDDLEARTVQSLTEVEKALLLRLLEQLQSNLSK
jgi:MarR family transcriptional regulator, organic hydroperoxide resistance regulator